jgi:hypothetical protein
MDSKSLSVNLPDRANCDEDAMRDVLAGVAITAAAIKVGERIYTAKRHAWAMNECWAEDKAAGRELTRVWQQMQGFVTSSGEFVNRFQAGAIAFRAGQTSHRYLTLLSEHVWPD